MPLKKLIQGYLKTRKMTEYLCSPLIVEDYGVQSIPEASPPKWHLAHTTWFFENFILVPFFKSYLPFNDQFGFLFNSYYQSVGRFLARPQRGVLARPSVEEVYQYRAYVDATIAGLADQAIHEEWMDVIVQRLELGIHHEQQHQELILSDVKVNFWSNPLRPRYRERTISNQNQHSPGDSWESFPEGIYSVGNDGLDFAFDNEKPAHSVFLGAFKLRSRLVTNGEFMQFIEAKGYTTAEYWLSDGWLAVQKNAWTAPLYWEKEFGKWSAMTLEGMQPLDETEPVCHISYYEADAFARWSEKRLPTEFEWEHAARTVKVAGNLLESERLKPTAVQSSSGEGTSSLKQLYGDVWEWTQSAYLPYPGFKPMAGSLGEYNGKFMCNQMVLRGGSFATPQSHIRSSYRNFFTPETRWQFTGLRLAEVG